ncbi:NYN domain-containing protein [Tunturiibacter gelidiferens]|uniref:NYN domain-containing protein n=1 Tax=Tunturiibacter gelidiferens TaxID=3069689 RepID=UPI003D9B681A
MLPADDDDDDGVTIYCAEQQKMVLFLYIPGPPDLPARASGGRTYFMSTTLPLVPSTLTPPPKRTMVFIDGANLFNSVKRRFEYAQNNCHIIKLARAVVAMESDRVLVGTRYYIGVPDVAHDARMAGWWNKKLSHAGRTGVTIFRRALKQRDLSIEVSGLVAQKATFSKLIEKGIDLRLGLDLVNFTLAKAFDVAIIFSQDSDISEAVEDAKRLANSQRRTIEIESAFPVDGISTQHGIHRTVYRTFDKTLYDQCLDTANYY